MRRLLAAVAVVALIGAACGSDGGDEDARETSGAAAPGTDTGAAGLRADLTALLQEHVYLAGLAVTTGLGAGLESAEFEAAAAALGENSRALSAAVGSVYGEEAGETFLGLWETHIGFFVDYTAAAAGGDEVGKEAAVADLDRYVEDFGAFLEGLNPNLPAEAVAEALGPHAQTLLAAIDAAVAGDAAVYTKLREAAGHMPAIAGTIAGAIVEHHPEKFA